MKGQVYPKNGKWYVVISYKKDDGEYGRKWIPTGLDEKGNKRQAQSMMPKLVSAFEDELKNGTKETRVVNDPLFADYIEQWIETAKPNLEFITYVSYKRNVKTIANYFRGKGITLSGLRPVDIQDYYIWLRSNSKTIQECEHHHVNIRRALYVAFKAELITSIPADKVERPKSPSYQAKYYNEEELKKLFEVLKGDRFELLYKMTAFYGLRRSEILGLKWSAIDFNENTISIQHSVTQTNYEGKSIIVRKDRGKNKSSIRTLPLLPDVKEMLLVEKERQEKNKMKYKKAYYTKDSEYIFVNDLGNLARPDTVSEHFKVDVLEKNGLPRIRFHELRHSCASLLLARGVSMKEIQEWLGHSTYTTTADIYSHLNYKSKVGTAGVMANIFGGKRPESSLSIALSVDDDTDEIAKYMKVKAEMERLGFNSLEDYIKFKSDKGERSHE